MVDRGSHLVQAAAHPATSTLAPICLSESAPEFVQRVQQLVCLLRERRPEGLRGVLAPLLAERDHILANEISREGAAILESYDGLILAALAMRYDSLDTAVAETTFAVAEIDGKGAISYANNALQRILPDAVGSDFAALFGARSAHVAEALSSDRRETLRLDFHRGNLPSLQLRGEIGPLTDEHHRSGAYALLLSLEGEEARFDALPDGILRLDTEGNVVFANRRAEEFLGASRARLAGLPAASVFGAGNSINGPPPIADWLRSADGRRELAELEPLDGRGAMPVRVTVAPSFDTAESRAGVLLTIVPIAKELVHADLQQLLSVPDCEPECLVRGVLRAIQRIVPYDLATFGIYSDDMRYHNTVVVYPQPAWTWTTAWFPLDASTREFLLSKHTWGGDLQATARQVSPSLDDDQVLNQLVNDGMKGFLTLPIIGGGQRVRASLTLLSKQANRYDGSEIEQMLELGVERALLIAEANIVRRREERVRALEEQLLRASDYRGLAGALALGVADCFGWDYVAVFGVDRREGVFRLIDQCNRSGYANVDSNYTQPLTEGLLGSALSRNRRLKEPNVDEGPQHGYKPIVPGRRSALAMPIRVVQQSAKPSSDEIEWMLSIESSQRNAFQGPDMTGLYGVLAQCEDILRQRWQKSVQGALLDAAEQAVVIVDRAGKVRLVNRRVNSLLSYPGTLLLGERLAALGISDLDRRLLASTDPVEQRRLTLRAGESLSVPALATQRPVNDDYGHRLWLFTDLREPKRQIDWGYLEKTVNEVAQSTRLPLMVAGNLMRGAAALLQDPVVKNTLESALRQLGKADITYERLAGTLAMRQEPDQPRQIFDVVEVLRHAVAELPEEDIRACELTDLPQPQAAKLFLTAGWPEQLSFAFRSLLSHLLLRRPISAKVHIKLHDLADGSLQITFSVPAGTPPEAAPHLGLADRITLAEERAREAAALAPETVALAVNRHNGEFAFERDEITTLAFTIKLRPMQPRSADGDGSA